MASRAAEKEQRRQERVEAEAATARAARARKLRNRMLLALGAGVLVLGAIFAFSNTGSGGVPRGAKATQAGAYPFAVGDPGPGSTAPPIELASTTGAPFSLARQKGRTTLLYFQEGLGCQPCWDQIRDIESQWSRFRAAGIDQMVSITTNDLGNLRRKARDEGLKQTPVLADPELKVSRAYQANQYGMMGDSADGHSFILVGPKGQILHRADYGGPPKFTMYLPPQTILADVRKSLRAAAAAG